RISRRVGISPSSRKVAEVDRVHPWLPGGSSGRATCFASANADSLPAHIKRWIQRERRAPTLPLVGRVAREARRVGVVGSRADGPPPPPQKGEGSPPVTRLFHTSTAKGR